MRPHSLRCAHTLPQIPTPSLSFAAGPFDCARAGSERMVLLRRRPRGAIAGSAWRRMQHGARHRLC
eukprot:1163150-Rhodomonas_salina.1